MNKRALATSIASRTKLVSMLERIRSRPALAVLVYHRVLRPEDHVYDRGVIEATPEQFDDQMAILRKRYDVVDADEMAELVADPRRLRRFRVAITFDDGYRDNFTTVFPILKSHGITATFFLPTQYVGTTLLPWWDQIANTIRNTRRAQIVLTYPRHAVVAIDPEDLEPAIRAVIRAYTRSEGVDLERFLQEVERACDCPLPREAPSRQFVSFEEAHEMRRAGMAIGSHTHSHTVLANMPEDAQRGECSRSRDVLGENGLSPESLAYPVGQRTSFTAATIASAKAAGYRYAFSNYGGVNRPDALDPFDIRRLGMDLDEDAPRLRLRLALACARGHAAW